MATGTFDLTMHTREVTGILLENESVRVMCDGTGVIKVLFKQTAQTIVLTHPFPKLFGPFDFQFKWISENSVSFTFSNSDANVLTISHHPLQEPNHIKVQWD